MKIGTKVIIRQILPARTLWHHLVDKKGCVVLNGSGYYGTQMIRVKLDRGQGEMSGRLYYLYPKELEVIKSIKLKKFSAWK